MGQRSVLRLLAVTTAVVVASATACGRFARSGEERAQPEPEDVAVGEGIEEAQGGPTTAPTVPGGAPAPTVPGVSAPAGPAAPTLAANQRATEHPDGWRIVLTVDGPLRYSTSADIALQVEAENVGSQPLRYDPNDLTNFALRRVGTTQVVWTDGSCRPARTPDALQTRAQTLQPSEHVSFVDHYPGPPDQAERDRCRVPSGRWEVVGYVTACPEGSLDTRERCDRTKTRQVTSPPLEITIG